jgi:hypothetical protein
MVHHLFPIVTSIILKALAQHQRAPCQKPHLIDCPVWLGSHTVTATSAEERLETARTLEGQRWVFGEHHTSVLIIICFIMRI